MPKKQIKTIAVRLEGGIGDHILGMRILPFIKARYPKHRIVVYSDAGGSPVQAQVAGMSPFVSDVVITTLRARPTAHKNWGLLENIDSKYLKQMRRADLFFDACGGVSFPDILKIRPVLNTALDVRKEADKILKPFKGCIFVGLDVSKHGLDYLRKNKKIVLIFMKELLKNPKVRILNFYTTNQFFWHWPRLDCFQREVQVAREALKIGELWNMDKRVIPVVGAPIGTVAALLERCSYFIGVDNGIKHLAWALNIPLTYFMPEAPEPAFALRWMPDVNRALLFKTKQEDLLKHTNEAKKACA